ncbi:hypothetical protein, conserved [Eimeria maxima]|uniref:Replication termination factor 2 n=1 Tax=Eimeria maxima TaxID=5804 RepID=U6MCS4_EIMMA|nr:hypothetical protein, conserved [Eimeria maxima]CDJ60868.1 hypothetical protein, conserved [Eimeria maxima]
MGGDGGSFSHRTEMVRTKGFKFLRNLGGMGYTPNTQIREGDERLGKNESRDLRSSACAYSQEKLQPPLLACRIGRLYNKEAVIKALLEKALPPHMRHVKSLKDMKELRVEINASTGFPVCPITNADLSSGVRASIVWPCGFIISNRALEAMTLKDGESNKLDSNSNSNSSNNKSTSVESGRPKIRGSFVCPMCAKEHDATEDLIPLSPDEEETSQLLEKALLQQQAKLAAKKKNKAAAAAAGPSAASGSSTVTPSSAQTDAKEEAEKPKATTPENTTGTPASHASNKRKHEVLAPLPTSKLLRDWVLEAEAADLPPPANSSKHRKVVA